MGESALASGLARAAIGTAFAVALAGCGQIPLKPSPAHVGVSDPGTRPEGAIPAPVQMVPVLPPPSPAARPETYSVVVNNVRVQDLLFALARDAKLNVDIHPGITGTVTLNAIDQTLQQLLGRISRQTDMRYEMDGQTLSVMRDTPFLRTYKVDFVSASRNVKMQSTSSTQFGGGAGAAGGGAGSGSTGSTATIDVTSTNQLWDTIVQNLKDILQETDKVLPTAVPAAAAAAPPPPAPAQPGAAPGQPAAATQAPAQPSVSFREAASVIGNRESGVLFIRATSRQHEKVQEFLDQVLASAKRQVLIEATIAEVQLNNEYQRGIDWSRVRRGASGVTLRQASAGTPAAISTSSFIIDAATASIGFQATVRLLESFGDVRVLSSPKVSVLNNQTALLRVTRDIVYFTLTPSTQPITVASATVAGTGVFTIQPAFTTTPNIAAEGFMMSVLPQISDADTIVLNVRPTIRRRVAFATDPNPALSAANPNLIPVFETRELDSILRIQSGQTAVLGGLMQDQVENTEDGIPGVRNLPIIGPLTSQRKDVTRKTELVIFLRATVIRDASVDSDFRDFRGMLPGADFFAKPNPGRQLPRQ